MDNYLISVVVAVYNKENTLKRCLDSILKNKNKLYEIVVINDGSTDDSWQIIEKYKDKYSNIKAYDKKHIGLSLIRKNVTSFVSGEYILFVDADDTINDELVDKLYEVINQYEPDIVKYDINEVNSIKNKMRYVMNLNKVYSDGKEALMDWNVYNYRYSLFAMYCFKKSVYEKSKKYFYELYCYEDVANVPKIIFGAQKIVSIDYLGYNYYRNNDSITNTIGKEDKLLQFKMACDNLIAFFEYQLGEKDRLYLKIKDYYLFHLKRKSKL